MKRPTASISFQVMPKTKNMEKTVQLIDSVIDCVKRSGIHYEVGPMETTMEGDLATLIEIVKKSHYLCIQKGATSVFTNIKVLYNPKGVMTIEEKVKKHR